MQLLEQEGVVQVQATCAVHVLWVRVGDAAGGMPMVLLPKPVRSMAVAQGQAEAVRQGAGRLAALQNH